MGTYIMYSEERFRTGEKQHKPYYWTDIAARLHWNSHITKNTQALHLTKPPKLKYCPEGPKNVWPLHI